MDEKERKKLVEEIAWDICLHPYSYKDFIFDCVRKEIESWPDEDLLNWGKEQ